MLQLDVNAVHLISVFWEEGRDLFVSPYFPFHSCATSPWATDSLAVLRQVGGLICEEGICTQKLMLQNTGADFAVYSVISYQQAWQSPKTLVTGFFCCGGFGGGRGGGGVPLSLLIYKKRTKIQTHAIRVIGYVNSAG